MNKNDSSRNKKSEYPISIKENKTLILKLTYKKT